MKKYLLLLLVPLLILSCKSTSEQELVDAIKAGDKAKVQSLLDAGADPNKDASSMMGEGTTATFEAASTGNMEMLEMLIKAGGKVDHVMEFGTMKVRLFDKLSFAIGYKLSDCKMTDKEVNDYVKIIDKVVGLGADIGGKPKGGDFDVHIETQYDKRNAIFYLAAHSGFSNNDIDPKCMPYMKTLLKTYMKHGADINSTNAYNTTALIYHTQRRHPNMINVLLDVGADKNKTGGEMGASPMWYALHTDMKLGSSDEFEYNKLLTTEDEVTKLLRSKGAKEICEDC